MKHRLIIIDSGHGYNTKGKSSLMDNNTVFKEWEYTRILKMRLISLLHDAGIEFVDIVTENNDIPLKERVKRANMAYIANINKNPYLISLHGDAYTSKEANGITVFTSKGLTQSDRIANVFVNELSNLGWKNRYDIDAEGNKGREENFYILRKTVCPSILLELGFYTNKEEVQKMNDADTQQLIVQYLFNAIWKCAGL